ncbi:MAG: cytochrome c peroxidase [Lentimonas sp.]|jgi:cytochrome c peroxidase
MKILAFILLSLACYFSSSEIIGLRPSHFPKPNYSLDSSAESIQLGRALFYDPLLSLDGTISCASCHSPYNAFAHTDHAVSHGIGDSIGTRNAPALFNLAWQKELMWDGAINHIETQALAPISHPGEMGESLPNLLSKLQKSSLYPSLFRDAYGDTSVTSQRMLKALSAFQLSLVSANAKYDRVVQKIDSFTTQEKAGYQLFKTKCNSCHTEPLFTNHTFKNNGLRIDPEIKDVGRYAVTLQAVDSFLFKVPSLRNLSYTYPYMHDGRFQKINEVLNHYTNGINNTIYLSKELQQGIKLSSNEKVDLTAFLLTLNDQKFILTKTNKYPIKILKPKQ